MAYDNDSTMGNIIAATADEKIQVIQKLNIIEFPINIVESSQAEPSGWRIQLTLHTTFKKAAALIIKTGISPAHKTPFFSIW